MKCPKDSEWPLFYYQDLPKKRLEILKEHLKICPKCQEYCAALSGFLSGVKQKPVSLNEGEFSVIVDEVKKRAAARSNFLLGLKDDLDYFLQEIKWKLFSRPQVAFVAMLLLAGMFLLPLHRQQALFEQGIMELQLELASEGDVFDTFLDLYPEEYF